MLKLSDTEVNLIDLQILKEQMTFTTQIREFQEGVRTRMQKKYSPNHNIVTFQPSEIIKLRIPK